MVKRVAKNKHTLSLDTPPAIWGDQPARVTAKSFPNYTPPPPPPQPVLQETKNGQSSTRELVFIFTIWQLLAHRNSSLCLRIPPQQRSIFILLSGCLSLTLFAHHCLGICCLCLLFFLCVCLKSAQALSLSVCQPTPCLCLPVSPGPVFVCQSAQILTLSACQPRPCLCPPACPVCVCLAVGVLFCVSVRSVADPETRIKSFCRGSRSVFELVG